MYGCINCRNPCVSTTIHYNDRDTGAIDWKPQKDWNAYLEDGKCATATMNVTESSTRQDAVWVVDPHPDAAVDSIVSV